MPLVPKTCEHVEAHSLACWPSPRSAGVKKMGCPHEWPEGIPRFSWKVCWLFEGHGVGIRGKSHGVRTGADLWKRVSGCLFWGGVGTGVGGPSGGTEVVDGGGCWSAGIRSSVGRKWRCGSGDTHQRVEGERGNFQKGVRQSVGDLKCDFSGCEHSFKQWSILKMHHLQSHNLVSFRADDLLGRKRYVWRRDAVRLSNQDPNIGNIWEMNKQ